MEKIKMFGIRQRFLQVAMVMAVLITIVAAMEIVDLIAVW